MFKTPGVVVPSTYGSNEALIADVRRRDKLAGFTELNLNEFEHSDDADDILAHYGIKGMKWGVHKPKGTQSADSKRHSEALAKPLNQLSDKELREALNRVNMEQRAKKLNQSKATKGHNAIKSLLAVGITVNALIALAKSPAVNIVAEHFQNKAGN